MAKKKRYKCKVGLIIAIPVPDGRFAFARVFNDNYFGVYSLLSEKIEPVEKIVEHEIVFFKAATDSAVISGEWPIVGEEPFPDEESAWAPPQAAGTLPQDDRGIPSPMLYLKGKMKSARIEDLIGLDRFTFSQRPELFTEVLVNRLIKGNHAKYRVRP